MFLFSSLYLQSPKSLGGEIGRRTAFRWQRSKGCAGSNPVLGTKPSEKSEGFFILRVSRYYTNWTLKVNYYKWGYQTKICTQPAPSFAGQAVCKMYF